MSELKEERIVVEDVPVERRPTVESRKDSVVKERRGMSGVAVAALVVAAMTGAVVITMLVINGQQRGADEALALERARTVAAQQTAQGQPPVTVNMPATLPAVVSVPIPIPGPAQPSPLYLRTTPSNASIEIDVTSRLQNDAQLRSYAIDVRVTNGTATLSGYVPDDDLRKRAGKLAKLGTGVRTIVNNISIRP